MKASWGKVRIGVIAIFCAAALAIVGLHRSSGRAYSADPTPTLFVTDSCTNAVTAYPAASNGDVAPLAPAPTGLSEPGPVAIDASGNIYAANTCNYTVTIYAKGSKGDSPPTAIIGGPNTGLSPLYGIAVDSSGKIYVTNCPACYNQSGASSVTVYPPLGKSTGLLNEVPIATISGSNTGLESPSGIALDSSGNIYVGAFAASSVSVYPPLGKSTGLLNESPIATISGSDTGLVSPAGIALDSGRNIYVDDFGATSLFIYPPLGSSTGPLNEAPTASISGADTLLEAPYGIAVDSSGSIYVTDSGATSVFVYPPLGSSTGPLDEAPSATISGSNTGLVYPQGIALNSSGNIYVGDWYAASVFVYPAKTNGNVAPSSASISTTMTTGLGSPEGIALDSSGNIYAANCPACYGYSGIPSVFVYSAGSNGNAAPTASISGSNTGLNYPYGIAVDSSGNVYLADEGTIGQDGGSIPPSVFVYPAGSHGNVAPTASISGTSTGLDTPYGIAVDSSGNIYVADDGDQSCDDTESVYVYPANTSGNVAPIATIGGTSTDLCFPTGIAVDSSGKIYVADNGATSVFVYPPLGSSTGPLNEAPLATISGSSTGLFEPIGISVNSSGNIYVADNGEIFVPGDVLVYSAGSHGNVAPTATISGPLTELAAPLFIAFQPATTTSTTTLSAAPSTIDFGNVDATATTKAKKMMLTNKGTTAALIETVTALPPFTISSGADTCSGKSIAAKKKCEFEVEFSPATPGIVSDQTINVTYNGTSPKVSLSGTGIAVTLKAPSQEKFSSVAAGGTGKPKAIKISNPATVSVSLGTTSISGNDPGAFTKMANSCTGTLAAKPGNCTITMEFTPKSGATGAQSATVGFSYTYGANTGSVSVSISGTVK